jgi:cell wall-associated NlpC family hydrolase
VPPAKYRRESRHYRGDRRQIVRTAKRYLGVRYRYGGTNPRGFDCSGYVMYIYRKNGIPMPRSLSQQYRSGKRISLKRARPGDLVFFNISGRRISHVGLYVGNRTFIHAPRTGKRISFADMNKRYWRKRYAGAVTYL